MPAILGVKMALFSRFSVMRWHVTKHFTGCPSGVETQLCASLWPLADILGPEHLCALFGVQACGFVSGLNACRAEASMALPFVSFATSSVK
jgi:hypothetical protein